MTNPWQRTFRAFAGPGIAHPSDSMRICEAEAAAILADLAACDWLPPLEIGSGEHAGYAIHHARQASATAIFDADGIVGFYAGSYLWIARQHRGIGLSTPLILAAAQQRGGSVLAPGVTVQGYTRIGMLAHRKAHHHAVTTAIAAGLSVPGPVLAEWRQDPATGKADGRAIRHTITSGGLAG